MPGEFSWSVVEADQRCMEFESVAYGQVRRRCSLDRRNVDEMQGAVVRLCFEQRPLLFLLEFLEKCGDSLECCSVLKARKEPASQPLDRWQA